MIKTYKSNLTFNQNWQPIKSESLITTSNKILAYIKASQRGHEITAYELAIYFRYANQFENLIAELVKEEFITRPEPYMLYIDNEPTKKTVSYSLTKKGELHLVNEYKKWYEKDFGYGNLWKVINLFIGFGLGIAASYISYRINK